MERRDMLLIITTAGSRAKACLENLLRQIQDSGWHGLRFLVCDGAPVRANRWFSIVSPRREGQRRTYWKALSLGVEQTRGSGDDRFLILEDDVELCRNALAYIERTPIPRDLDFITWFDGHMIRPDSSPGIYSVPAERFFCLQGVTWRRSTAERLLRSPEAAAWTDRHSGDTLIGKILRGRRYGVHVPNLVQHMGAQSICNPGQGLNGVRTASNYPGRRFDARQLSGRSQGEGERGPIPSTASPARSLARMRTAAR